MYPEGVLNVSHCIVLYSTLAVHQHGYSNEPLQITNSCYRVLSVTSSCVALLRRSDREGLSVVKCSSEVTTLTI